MIKTVAKWMCLILYKITVADSLMSLSSFPKNLCDRDFPGGPVVRLHAPNGAGPGSIPGRGTRSHMHATTKSSRAATKDPACRN